MQMFQNKANNTGVAAEHVALRDLDRVAKHFARALTEMGRGQQAAAALSECYTKLLHQFSSLQVMTFLFRQQEGHHATMASSVCTPIMMV